MHMPEYEFDLSELDAEGESAERASIKKPSSAPSFRPRPAPSQPTGVTQAQLEAAMTRVDGKIKTVADGMGTLSTRVNSLATATKKEMEDRKKGLGDQNKDVNQKLQMLALLPMLIQQPSSKVAPGTLKDANGIDIAAVATPDDNALDAILPLLLVSGMGGSTSGSGLSLGGDGTDGGMMLLAIALAMSKK
jgi:hypothetical protein